ncbi:DUF4406 domain-containing protein [Brucella sp. HL-2]|nr:DUF4406 domain-containing protein [Brucella sp. HL-2]MCV9910220.1 DUF4406 domain-containing protein [Brucella sp. HL-2]
MRKIYLSGPMTGIPENNHPLFHKVAAELRENGDFVFSPAEYAEERGVSFDLRAAFADYCQFICKEADALIVLPGWQNSFGARAEVHLARNFPIQLFEWDFIKAGFAGLPPYRVPTTPA